MAPENADVSRWAWALERTVSQTDLAEALLVGASGFGAALIVGHDALESLRVALFGTILAFPILFLVNLARSKSLMKREREAAVLAWRCRYAWGCRADGGSVVLSLWASEYTDLHQTTCEVLAPGATERARPSWARSDTHIYPRFEVEVVEWHYPGGFEPRPAQLPDGTYWITWRAANHKEPIASATLMRVNGAFVC